MKDKWARPAGAACAMLLALTVATLSPATVPAAASDQGIPVEDLPAQLPLQDEFAILASRIEEKFPADYSSRSCG